MLSAFAAGKFFTEEGLERLNDFPISGRLPESILKLAPPDELCYTKKRMSLERFWGNLLCFCGLYRI
ncbi:hypothetical protein [uncultured Oscillibacter sp.]|uniref:hypothetical protein n=1 Tax=uncultured Oscillibacter sp. TaxID=876091 RepID=UPI0025EF0A7D|nr:hypothetical protein [uncultured Oscillibacter sp.]